MTAPTTTHATPTRPANGNPALDARSAVSDLPITRPFERLIEQLGPQAVFGEPVRTGDTTVIPVAEVRTGFGFGGGHGHEAEEDGSGGGGGAAVRVTPRGYIVATDGAVRYRPIRGRFGPLALAGLALAAGLLTSFVTAWRS